jgi:hypothetical protein
MNQLDTTATSISIFALIASLFALIKIRVHQDMKKWFYPTHIVNIFLQASAVFMVATTERYAFTVATLFAYLSVTIIGLTSIKIQKLFSFLIKWPLTHTGLLFFLGVFIVTFGGLNGLFSLLLNDKKSGYFRAMSRVTVGTTVVLAIAVISFEIFHTGFLAYHARQAKNNSVMLHNRELNQACVTYILSIVLTYIAGIVCVVCYFIWDDRTLLSFTFSAIGIHSIGQLMAMNAFTWMINDALKSPPTIVVSGLKNSLGRRGIARRTTERRTLDRTPAKLSV